LRLQTIRSRFAALSSDKDVATPCAGTYAAVRLVIRTRPLHCTYSAHVQWAKPPARNPPPVSKHTRTQMCGTFSSFSTSPVRFKVLSRQSTSLSVFLSGLNSRSSKRTSTELKLATESKQNVLYL